MRACRGLHLLVIFSLLLLTACHQEKDNLSSPHLPDFSAYTDVAEKKLAFFNFLRPVVEAENGKVRRHRQRMLALREMLNDGQTVPDGELLWLEQLAKAYNLDTEAMDEEKLWLLLKRRVDVVPYRLALAQAANESNWGTSRFAREGLNLFGMWCFTPGCGLVPLKRVEGLTHEVARYASVNDSVAAYIRSINRVHMYTPLRILRRDIRKRGEKPTALELAQELSGYSERGEGYVKDIQEMVRSNYDLMAGGRQTTQGAFAVKDAL